MIIQYNVYYVIRLAIISSRITDKNTVLGILERLNKHCCDHYANREVNILCSRAIMKHGLGLARRRFVWILEGVLEDVVRAGA